MATTAVQVGRYNTLELVFTASLSPAKPFDTYLLKLELTDPSGRKFIVEGFFDGDGRGGATGKIWKVRITPDKTGLWSWRTVPGDVSDSALLNKSGQINVVETSNTGGVVASGKYFKFQNGKPVYLVGNFLDFSGGIRSTHTYMSETTSDTQRSAILTRARDSHTANKANIYFANKGDYSSQSVTPWVGSASSNDKNKFDLARWKKYDQYIQTFKTNKMLAEMWFFADDSGFGSLGMIDKKRLARYAMARTSAFSHTMYVVTVEYEEGWTAAAVTELGNYIQTKNPWRRTVSVHQLPLRNWAFSGQSWAQFWASQPGNTSSPGTVNSFSITQYNNYNLPHIAEEIGIMNSSPSTIIRNRMWAAFAAGTAGIGTGSDLKALQRFIAQSKIPFQRMKAANNLVNSGGSTRFVLAEAAHHYLVYSQSGAFTMNVTGSNLKGYWFDPRNNSGNLSAAFTVTAGSKTYTPPNNASLDWVLWITDSTNLSSGITHPSPGSAMISVQATAAAQAENEAAWGEPLLAETPATTTIEAGKIISESNSLTENETEAEVSQEMVAADILPGTVYISPDSAGLMEPGSLTREDGLAFEEADILAYDTGSGMWNIYLDGSDVGLSSLRSFAMQNDGSILLTLGAAAEVPGAGLVNGNDILRFVPTTLGEDTQGAFELFVGGARLGLEAASETIDSLAITPAGELVIGLENPGDLNRLALEDEDLAVYTPAGWSLFFDGSQAELSDQDDEDVRGAWIDPASGLLYLSTLGSFSIGELAGSNANIITCDPADPSSCSYAPGLFWLAADAGFPGRIDGLSLGTTPVVGTFPAPQAEEPAVVIEGSHPIFMPLMQK